MKVADLIEQLKTMPPNAEVHYTYNYGDYWRTNVAPVVEDVTLGYVKYSEYHRMDKLICVEEDFDDNADTLDEIDGSEQVVVIG